MLVLSVLACFITAVVGAAKDSARNDQSLDEISVTYVAAVSPKPKGPKPESYHSPAGLAMFIVSLFFALTGNLRSYVTTATVATPSKGGGQQDNEDDKPSDFNSEAEKTEKTIESSFARIARRWDQCHSAVGILILFVSWWQCQSGLDLFEYRFSNSWFPWQRPGMFGIGR